MAAQKNECDALTHDDMCHVCRLGGDLLCCDGCPNAIHLECSDLETHPQDDEPFWCNECKTKEDEMFEDEQIRLVGQLVSSTKRKRPDSAGQATGGCSVKSGLKPASGKFKLTN